MIYIPKNYKKIKSRKSFTVEMIKRWKVGEKIEDLRRSISDNRVPESLEKTECKK